MIFSIKGILEQADSNSLVICTTTGISYEIFSTTFDIAKLEIGEEYKFFIQEIIREDSYQLYGFLSESTKKVFNELIKINGIGPKVALTILSQLSINELISTVRSQSITNLLSVKGLGKKGAEKLLLALRDKWVVWLQLMPEEVPLLYQPIAKPNQQPEYIIDAIEALVTLGFDRKSAQAKVNQLATNSKDTKQIITQALAELSKVN